MERRRIRVLGRVQGVGFRATTAMIAAGRPVTGWVRNEADGSVLIEVQGEAAEIDAFLAAVRERFERGIREERSEVAAAASDERGFTIRRSPC